MSLQVCLPYLWIVINIITVGEHQIAERHKKCVDIEILKSPQALKMIDHFDHTKTTIPILAMDQRDTLNIPLRGIKNMKYIKCSIMIMLGLYSIFFVFIGIP